MNLRLGLIVAFFLHLYERPIVSVTQIRELTGTTFPAANELASRLEDLGILVEFTGQKRHRRFRYGPYVCLFDDGTA